MSEAPARLLFEGGVRKGRYVRVFLRMLLGTLTVVGAYLALNEAASRGLVSTALLDVGKVVAVVLGGLFAVRGLLNLFYALFRKSEHIRVYDRGLLWKTGRKEAKYQWRQIVNFREGARGRLIKRGAHVLTMNDGTRHAFKWRHGDPRLFARAVRPYAAQVTGARIGQALRDGTSVKLHPNLEIQSAGVIAKRKPIRWETLIVNVEKNRLHVRSRSRAGTTEVASFPLHAVDNVGGFIDLARSMTEQMRDARRVAASQQRPGGADPFVSSPARRY